MQPASIIAVLRSLSTPASTTEDVTEGDTRILTTTLSFQPADIFEANHSVSFV
jgi:hypothetical protein